MDWTCSRSLPTAGSEEIGMRDPGVRDATGLMGTESAITHYGPRFRQEAKDRGDGKMAFKREKEKGRTHNSGTKGRRLILTEMNCGCCTNLEVAGPLATVRIGKAEKLNFWRRWGVAHRVWTLKAWLGPSDLASKGSLPSVGILAATLGPWIAHMAGWR